MANQAVRADVDQNLLFIIGAKRSPLQREETSQAGIASEKPASVSTDSGRSGEPAMSVSMSPPGLATARKGTGSSCGTRC